MVRTLFQLLDDAITILRDIPYDSPYHEQARKVYSEWIDMVDGNHSDLNPDGSPKTFENKVYLCPECMTIMSESDLFYTEGDCINHGDTCNFEDNLIVFECPHNWHINTYNNKFKVCGLCGAEKEI